MNHRLSFTTALGFAAALAFAADAGAQSDRRIPVRKGENPTPARTDTVVVRDTIRMTDTVTVVRARTDTVVQRVEVPPPPTPWGKFYAGLYGGAALPIQELTVPHEPGFIAGGIIGWDSWRAPLGLRLDAGYTRMGEDEDWAGAGPGEDPASVGDPELWHANLDAKLRLPFAHTAPVHLYLLGGLTYNRFRGFTMVDGDNNNAIVISDDNWRDKIGGNLGAGLAFGFGGARLFLESRLQTMNIVGTVQNYVPVVLGITF